MCINVIQTEGGMSDIQTNEVHVRENAFAWEKFSFGYPQKLYLILRMTFSFFPIRESSYYIRQLV